MKTKLLLVGVALCALSSFCSAGIIGVNYADDRDGAFVCDDYTWSGDPVEELSVNVDGVQHGALGHINGEIITDSAIDPTLSIGNTIDNDLDFAWTAYNVNVYMSSAFTIENAIVSVPNDWTVSVTQPVAVSGGNQHGEGDYNYMGQIQYLSGTPVAIGETLDFSYDMVFEGYTSFKFCQEMEAIPEPASLGLIVLVSTGLCFTRRIILR